MSLVEIEGRESTSSDFSSDGERSRRSLNEDGADMAAAAAVDGGSSAAGCGVGVAARVFDVRRSRLMFVVRGAFKASRVGGIARLGGWW